MRVVLFYHSLVSDWNHGNAHFLRGIAGELIRRGHNVRIFEPENSWSRTNLTKDYGLEPVKKFEIAFPDLFSTRYDVNRLAIDEWVQGADLILAHEWNDPRLISALNDYRKRNSSVRVFFHDTHHRAVTAPHELAAFALDYYDGVLAYGASLKRAYERLGWGKQVHIWHEAADTHIFYPRKGAPKTGDVVWIGNWGDEERTKELHEFFIDPVAHLGLKAATFGVRYPAEAIEDLRAARISHNGWLANFEVPLTFSRFRATLHIPRRPYTRDLSGIPTIRPFEALACGIPLISAPWEDTEGLFRIGEDLLMANNGHKMEQYISDVLNDSSLAESLARSGLETIRTRHTCAHRVDELLKLYRGTLASESSGVAAQQGAYV